MRSTGNRYRLLITGGILAAALLSMRYLLPLALPFLVGLAVAWIAEPLARFLSRRAKFPGLWPPGPPLGGVPAPAGPCVSIGTAGAAGDGPFGLRAARNGGRPGPGCRPGPGLAIPPGPRRAGAAAAGAGGKHYPAVLQRLRPGGGRSVPGAGGRLSDHCDIAGYVCIFGHGGCIQLYDFGAAATAATLSPGGSCRQPGPSGSCRCCRTCGSTWVDGFGHSASSWASRSCC